MKVFFVDDSGQDDPLRAGLGSLLAIGTIAFPGDQLKPFADALTEIKREHGIPDDEELKWNPPKGSAQASAGGESIRRLRIQVLRAASACNARTAVVVLDHAAAFKELAEAEAGIHILTWLYERIEMMLGPPGDTGIVVADEPGGGRKAERAWLSEVLTLTNDGTRHVQAKHVVLPIMTAPSDHVPHLQVADLVVAATTAAVAGRRRGLDLVEELKPLAHRRGTGEIGGAGLVLWPRDRLLDLHWWVFGETHYRANDGQVALGPHHQEPSRPAHRRFLTGSGL